MSRFRLLLAFCLVGMPSLAAAQAAQDATLTAPDGQEVQIDRDDYGVPHITADTETALFFGQGFAVAQDRLFQMETFWRAATGRLAEIQGPAALPQDKAVRTVYYTPEERAAQFDALSAPVQTMMTAYVAGVNTYIDSTAQNPAAYLPAEYQLGGFAPEAWDQDKLVAVLQFFMRRFGEIGGDELARLTELETQGPAWFEANRPVNDPTASTTIQSGTPPPAQPWAPRAVTDYPAGTAAFAAAGAAHVAAQRQAADELYQRLGVPLRFGSFAATIASDLSDDGSAMLLGAPQMGLPTVDAKAVTSEVTLEGAGIRLTGMTVPGIPGVIIGRTQGRTWTLTTGYTDNTDTYLEVLDASRQQYLYNGEYQPFEAISETFVIAGGGTDTDTHFRTVHGPVYFLDAEDGLAATWKFAFWDRELDMVEAFYDVWKAESVEAFDAAGDRVTMSFNLLYMDTDLEQGTGDSEKNTAYWHVGRYPIRPGTADPRLPLRGTGEDEWVGIVPPDALPHEVNPAKGYFVNWNNKPAPWWNQGDNMRWTANAPGGTRPYDGVDFLEDHLRAAAPVSFEDLQELFRIVRSNGTYNEYPGTYQQVLSFDGCSNHRTESVVPPGQSGFVAVVGGAPVPSPNFSDQWALYQSSAGSGPIQMKPMAEINSCVVNAEPGADAGALDLSRPAPNPVTSTTALRFTLAQATDVRLSVVDALGREVTVLADGPHAAGEHPVTLDAGALAPGVYVVRLVAADRVTSQRVVVAR